MLVRRVHFQLVALHRTPADEVEVGSLRVKHDVKADIGAWKDLQQLIVGFLSFLRISRKIQAIKRVANAVVSHNFLENLGGVDEIVLELAEQHHIRSDRDLAQKVEQFCARRRLLVDFHIFQQVRIAHLW